MRRAKIVATLGPASQTIEKISELILAGMNVVRVNMSHGTYDGHALTISNVRKASKLVGKEVGILLDLQGPKIRVDKLPVNLILSNDEIWALGSSKFKDAIPEFKEKYIPTIYEKLVDDSKVGGHILFDDGLLEAIVIEKLENYIKIKVLVGGELKSNKGINLPDIEVSAPSFTDKDKEDLLFGLQQGIDFVALSFVRRAADILEVKYLLHALKVNVPIIAKIEKPEAIDNMESIINVTDAIMIARGDMGVELGNHLVPAVQKKLIALCNATGTPVITATQMLESMITNSRPTRAEASDVANAVWDGTDAVMLSAETASGKYPIEAVQMMNSLILEAEKTPRERPLLRNMNLASLTSALQVAASLIAEKTNARWIISVTETGDSCLKMTKFRPKTPVLGVSPSIGVIRKLNLYWGINPYYIESAQGEDIALLEKKIVQSLRLDKNIKNGDKVVFTRGDGKYFEHGMTHTVRVEIIKNLPQEQDRNTDQEQIQEVNFERGSILLDTSLCASCQKCIAVCPHDIWIASNDDIRETRINVVKAPNCAFDMQCVDVCPTGAIEILPKI
ncbi:MAG: pyruvate kinase [Bacteriovoracaceae bacterium]